MKLNKSTNGNDWELDQLKQSQSQKQDEYETKSAVSIICMNLTAHKYYVYDPNGILQNRINYYNIYE